MRLKRDPEWLILEENSLSACPNTWRDYSFFLRWWTCLTKGQTVNATSRTCAMACCQQWESSPGKMRASVGAANEENARSSTRRASALRNSTSCASQHHPLVTKMENIEHRMTLWTKPRLGEGTGQRPRTRQWAIVCRASERASKQHAAGEAGKLREAVGHFAGPAALHYTAQTRLSRWAAPIILCYRRPPRETCTFFFSSVQPWTSSERAFFTTSQYLTLDTPKWMWICMPGRVQSPHFLLLFSHAGEMRKLQVGFIDGGSPKGRWGMGAAGGSPDLTQRS